MKRIDLTTNIFGLAIFSKSKEQLLEVLNQHLIHSRRVAYIFTPNPEQIIQSRGKSKINKDFFQALQSADFLVPDGIGLVFASKFKRWSDQSVSQLTQRIAGADLVLDILKLLGKSKGHFSKKIKVLIIGGKNYSDQNIQRLAQQYAVEVMWEFGFKDVSKQLSSEAIKITEKIEKLRPTVVFVAFGAPYQEIWLAQNREVLNKNGVSLAMAVGGSFDYLFGITIRAPIWIQKLGFEWLFRLILQPWRWRRQLRLLKFVWLVLKNR
jgi:N-acetylglucosaminyldiphosphoundecaprenol N-acetyl-beta-D-mannosaminyltransferase